MKKSNDRFRSKVYSAIKTTIANHLVDITYTIYIFGSRAKNIAKINSDVDICIETLENIVEKKDLILLEFKRSTFPYRVDIVDYKLLNGEFKKNIDLTKLILN